MHSHFVSYIWYRSTEDNQVHNGATVHLAYPTMSMPCLLMPWRRQQVWYCTNKPEYSVSGIRRVNCILYPKEFKFKSYETHFVPFKTLFSSVHMTTEFFTFVNIWTCSYMCGVMQRNGIYVYTCQRLKLNWGLNKMSANLQKTFWNAFYCKKLLVFWFTVHWSLYQMIIHVISSVPPAKQTISWNNDNQDTWL